MAQSQHTPGPWRVAAYKIDQSIIIQDTTSWVPGHIPRVVVQAFDYDCLKAIPGKPITGEKEANAHLIAAAPDMLEALKTCKTVLQAMVDGDELALSYADPQDWLNEVLTAINKAKGNM